jgi:hypothetical protein
MGSARGVMGDISTTALISTGANVVIPGSGPVVAVGITVLNSLFGSNQDAVRLAREQWFEQAARQGSPTAARIMIGGTLNTASHEIPFYRDGISRLLADPRTAPVMINAQRVGSYWDSTDDASSSKMRALVENELNRLGSVVPSSSAPSSSSSPSTLSLTGTYTPVAAPSRNWVPWIVGGLVVAGAVVVLPKLTRK